MDLCNDGPTVVHEFLLVHPAKAKVVPDGYGNSRRSGNELRAPCARGDQDLPVMSNGPSLELLNFFAHDVGFLAKDNLGVGCEEPTLERGTPALPELGGRTGIRIERFKPKVPYRLVRRFVTHVLGCFVFGCL